MYVNISVQAYVGPYSLRIWLYLTKVLGLYYNEYLYLNKQVVLN